MSTIENLSTLKINTLSQTQYEREKTAGTLEANAMYLTPDTETSIYYGTCSSAADSTAKTVDIEGFRLTPGVIVVIKFTNSNSVGSPTLNVSGTGAKPMYRYGTTVISTGTSTSGWIAGAVQTFVYDGTGWVREYWANSTYSNGALGQGYGECTTAATTKAKTATVDSYTLTAGGITAIKFQNSVPASATLNISSKGAKNIYYKGAAIADGVIKAGDIVTFIYKSQYHVISILRDEEEVVDFELPGYLKYGEKIAQFNEITIQGNTALETAGDYIKLYSGYISPTAIESINIYTNTTLEYAITPSESDISYGNGWSMGSLGFWAMGGGTHPAAGITLPSAGLWVYSGGVSANTKIVITPKVAIVTLAPEFLPSSLTTNITNIKSVTDKFTISGSNFRIKAKLLPYSNASTSYELGNSSYRWNKLFLPNSASSGIDVGGTLISGTNLTCLSGLKQNVQNALTDLQNAVDAGMDGGSFVEAEIAAFDTYYDNPSITNYNNLPRQVGFGRRGMDKTTYNPYIYRPDIAYTIDSTISNSGRLYVKDDTMMYDSLDLAFSQNYCHYLHNETTGTWHKLVGVGGTAGTGTNTTVAGGATNVNDLQVKVNSSGYFEVINSAWDFMYGNSYKLYVMDWFPLLEPAENASF